MEERLRHQHHVDLQSLREAHRHSLETLKQQSEQELQTLRFELEDEGKAMLGKPGAAKTTTVVRRVRIIVLMVKMQAAIIGVGGVQGQCRPLRPLLVFIRVILTDILS